MATGINPALMDLANWSIANRKKQAFVPPGADVGAGGGMPPGGAPMDPAVAGGMPPGGGAPPGGDMASVGGSMMPSPDASLAPPAQPMTPDMITQAVTQAVQLAMNGGKGGKGAAKPDMNLMAQDIFQIKRMLLHLYSSMGMSIPPDVLDDPNRDPTTGAIGGTGPNAGPVPVQPGAAGAGPPAVATPAGAAPPMAPPAGPADAGGGKAASVVESIGTCVDNIMSKHDVASQASAVALLVQRIAKQENK